MAMEAQRIYAGTAGGKKYFYGDDGKLYDEAGTEQPEKLAEILRANFPPLPANKQRKKRTKPQLVQPSAPPPEDDEEWVDDNDPSTPKVRRFRRTKAIGGALASDLLRHAFPELHSAATKYRKIFNKSTAADKKAKTPKTKADKDKKKADRKRSDRELSLKIEQVASHVRTNGELLRQQLTAQETTIELLEKISNGAKSSGERAEGAICKLTGAFSAIKGWLLPALGIAGVAAAGAAAIYGSHRNMKHVDDLQHDEDVAKYGKETADEMGKLKSMNPLVHMKDIYDHIPTADARKPKDRWAARQAKKADSGDEWAPYRQNEENASTPATREAEKKKPGGKMVEIKGDSITFEARQIVLDARSIKISQGSSSSGMTLGSGAGASAGGGGAPQGQDGKDAQSDGVPPDTAGGQGYNGKQQTDGTAPPNGRVPQGSQFNPDMQTPWSPGGDPTKPGAPGQGGITGGAGASILGGQVYDRRGSAEAIKKNDVAPAMRFSGSAIPGQGGVNLNATGANDIVGTTSVKDLQNNLPFQKAMADFQKAYPNVSSEDIYKTIKGESSFKTNIQPNSSGYAGLFQMNNKDIQAAGYKGTLQDFIKEPAHVQLEYWKKTFQSQGFKADSLSNTGLANAAGSPKWQTAAPDTEIYGTGSAAWQKNPGWRGPDGRITKQSIIDYYNKKNALTKEEKQILDASKPKFNLAKGVGPDSKLTGVSSNMFSSSPTASMKTLGGVAQTADKLEEKGAIMSAKPADDPIKAPLAPYVNETNKVGGSGITTDLKEDEKGSWWGETPRAAQPTFGELNEKIDKLQKQANPMAKGLGLDDLDKQLRPVDNLNPTPGEIPDSDTSGTYHRDSQDMSENTDPPEKSEGNQSRISSHVNGAKKPKPIRKVDLDKYYPQYPKTTEAGSVVGMTVA